MQNLGNNNFATKQRYWQNTIAYTQNQQNTIKRPLIIYQKYVKTYIALYFPDLNPKIIPNCDKKSAKPRNLYTKQVCVVFDILKFLTFLFHNRQSHGLLYKTICPSIVDRLIELLSEWSFVKISLLRRHAHIVGKRAFSHKMDWLRNLGNSKSLNLGSTVYRCFFCRVASFKNSL